MQFFEYHAGILRAKSLTHQAPTSVDRTSLLEWHDSGLVFESPTGLPFQLAKTQKTSPVVLHQ